MIFPGQTLGGSADGKQKKFISTFNDDPYKDYLKQQGIQPNPMSQPNVNINANVTNIIPDDGTGFGGGGGGGNEDGGGGDGDNISGNRSYGAPTIEELMNMGIGGIADLFGRNTPFYNQEEFLEQYGMYVPEYDPYQQRAREKEYGLTTSGMRDEATAAKERIQGQFRGMNANFNKDVLQNRMLDSVKSQFDLANIRKKQDVRGIQESYYSDVMQAMQYLGEQGAFDATTYAGPDADFDWATSTETARWEFLDWMHSQDPNMQKHWNGLSQEKKQELYDFYMGQYGGN